MQIYLLILIGIETFVVFILLISLIFRSKHFEFLSHEVSVLAEGEKKFKTIEKERDDYLAMLVHELRSPLGVIRGSCDLLLTESGNLTADQIKEILTQMKKSSTSLLTDVNEILDVSKIESGRFEVKKLQGDFNTVLRDEANYYLPLANRKKVQLGSSTDDNLQAFEFDPERIKQVMTNLLSNALKYTPAGGKVWIESKKGADFAQVSISDTGPGIPDSAKAKLFNKFVQVGRSDGVEEKGTGLGLYIAKGIVEAHGGNIWIEDNTPRGSRFVFRLPLV